jgi:hypothetical protein
LPTNLLEGGVLQFILARDVGRRVARLEKHYEHASNVARIADLTKSRWILAATQ